MIKKTFCASVLILILGISSTHSFAQTSIDASGVNGGAIILGADSRACDGTIEGAIRYNAGNNCAEFCNGSAWTCPSGCVAESSCPNVGDVCTDGSLFAGFSTYGGSCAPMFVAASNQSAASQWSSVDVAPTTDFVDGKSNQAWIVANETLSNYPSFEICENLTAHTQTDWFLPSKTELFTMFINRTQINANATQNFTSQPYWSSTGRGQYDAYSVDFSNDGVAGYNDDATSYDVRCIRRN